MSGRTICRVATLLVCAVTLPAQIARAGAGAPDDAAALFESTCADCHGGRPENKAPTVEALRQLPFTLILQSMNIGIMQRHAAGLTPEQRVQVAKWLAAAEDGKRYQWLETRACARETPVTLHGTERTTGRHQTGKRGQTRVAVVARAARRHGNALATRSGG
jgi:cytochrome c553